MTKSSRYSLIALVVLVVVAVGVGVYYFNSINSEKVSADVMGGSSGSVAVYPLKNGWNELQNGAKSLTFNSSVIQVGGSRLTLYEAQQLEIVSEVRLLENNLALGKDIQQIAPLDKFEIYVKSISQTPKFIPER